MTTDAAVRDRYAEHLKAKVRARENPAARESIGDLAVLPDDIAQLCSSNPAACLELILATLKVIDSPHLIHAIGDGLLEDLLNERADAIHDEIVRALKKDERFRQAFACSKLGSVDPGQMAEWVDVLRDLGTTKHAERKRLFSLRKRD